MSLRYVEALASIFYPKMLEFLATKGWWAGEVNSQVGIFPSMCVSELVPVEVDFRELQPLGHLIGHGAYGNVHETFWRNEEVAVKLMAPNQTESAEVSVENIRKEAQLFGCYVIRMLSR